MKRHDATAGTPTNGSTQSATIDEPAMMSAVSRTGSPADDFSSAFQSACKKPAPSTASVTPSVISVDGISAASGGSALRGFEDGNEMRKRRRRRAGDFRQVIPQANLHRVFGVRSLDES